MLGIQERFVIEYKEDWVCGDRTDYRDSDALAPQCRGHARGWVEWNPRPAPPPARSVVLNRQSHLCPTGSRCVNCRVERWSPKVYGAYLGRQQSVRLDKRPAVPPLKCQKTKCWYQPQPSHCSLAPSLALVHLSLGHVLSLKLCDESPNLTQRNHSHFCQLHAQMSLGFWLKLGC